MRSNICLRCLVFTAVSTLLTGPAHAFVLGPTVPGNWGGGPATVTYSFVATGVSRGGEGAGNFTALSAFMPTGWKGGIVQALDAWSAVADISFVEVPDLGEAFDTAQQSGDIRFAGHAFDGAGGVQAHGYYPPANGVSAAGDIHFDMVENWKIGFGGSGFDIFQATAHQLGHAIGLAHTAVPGSLMNAFYTEAFSGPQADDIAGAQAIYGATPEPPTIALLILGLVSLRQRRSS